MSYHDHHLHPLGYVSMVTGLELMQASDWNDLAKLIASHATDTDGVIVGHRLNDEGLKERELPTRELLDEIAPDRPMLLYRYCGHIGIANSAALATAGIDSSTPDPEGGSLDRDRSGRPTGVVRETGLGLVSDALSPQVLPPTDAAILEALGGLTDLGIGSVTGMVSAGDPIWCGIPNELGTLLRISADLPIDIGVMVIAGAEEELRHAAELIERSGGRLHFHGWKEFADGSLGGHTAAMYEPFSDRPDTNGTLRLKHEHARTMAQVALDLGGEVAIHAIGDRANDEVLDVFESLIDDGAEAARLRVEHVSVVTDRTVERFGKLGVTASVQPAFLASEGDWLEKRLGADRMSLVYRFRSLVESGVTVLGGSDSPVEYPDPRVGIEAAVSRHEVNPAESLSRDDAEALFSPPVRP